MSDQAARVRLFLICVFVIGMAAQIALYAESFQVMPCGDDFAPPGADILRGQQEGPLALVRMSAQSQNYRPIQSLLEWAFGSISFEHRAFWVRVMHFVCMAVYAAVAMVWLRLLPVSRGGMIAAAAMLFAHPAMVGAVGGFDGFAGPLSVGFMWLGAAVAVMYRDRIATALPLIVLCFFVGGLSKEYSFAIGPLVAWTILVFWQRRWSGLILIGGALALSLAALMYVRQFTIPPGLNQGLAYIYTDPRAWAQNVALLTTAVLFLGSTAWVMLRGDTLAFATVGISSLAMLAFLAAGLRWRRQSRSAQTSDAEVSERVSLQSPGRWIVYLVGSFPMAASVPLLTQRVSEMYAVGLILPFALLFGLAFDGWMSRTARGGLQRGVGFAAFLLAMAVAAVSSVSKISHLRHMGEEANHKVHSALAALPEHVRDQEVATVHLEADLADQRVYSIFALNDAGQISQPWSLEWLAPDRGLKVQSFVVSDLSELDRSQHQYFLLWNPLTRSFELLD